MKSLAKEKIEAEKLFSLLEKHPLTQKIKAEKEAEILSKRQKAADKILELKK